MNYAIRSIHLTTLKTYDLKDADLLCLSIQGHPLWYLVPKHPCSKVEYHFLESNTKEGIWHTMPFNRTPTFPDDGYYFYINKNADIYIEYAAVDCSEVPMILGMSSLTAFKKFILEKSLSKGYMAFLSKCDDLLHFLFTDEEIKTLQQKKSNEDRISPLMLY